jgi:hypothetical protein
MSGGGSPLDRHARKQVLLTRIAFERADLRGEIAHLSRAVRWPNLLRGAVGGGLAKTLLGATGAAAPAGWLGVAWQLLKRYRVAAALLGGAAPLLRRRGWLRGGARLGALAAAAWVGWRAINGREPPST